MTAPEILNRLGRRGDLTITAKDGSFDVSFKAPGPYQGRGWCTTDESDFWSHCRLGASDWHHEGPDLDALVTECEEMTRPQYLDVDDLRFRVEQRRDSRTSGPPLPSYRRWHGWSPGIDRWLRTSDHAHEYLAGYLRDLNAERTFNAERASAAERRANDELRHRRFRAGVPTESAEGK